MITLGKLENGTVVDTAVADPENIPSFLSEWEVLPDGIGIGATFDGQTWTPYAGPQPPTPAELDAMADALVDEVFEQSKDAVRVMGETLAELIFVISNGQPPQNITQQQARTWVRSTFRDKYRGLIDT